MEVPVHTLRQTLPEGVAPLESDKTHLGSSVLPVSQDAHLDSHCIQVALSESCQSCWTCWKEQQTFMFMWRMLRPVAVGVLKLVSSVLADLWWLHVCLLGQNGKPTVHRPLLASATNKGLQCCLQSSTLHSHFYSNQIYITRVIVGWR